jgi:hypothetical protein
MDLKTRLRFFSFHEEACDFSPRMNTSLGTEIMPMGIPIDFKNILLRMIYKDFVSL